MKRERVQITIETTDLADEQLVRELCSGLPITVQGDTLKVTYTLNFDYVGEIYKRLTRIETLLDRPNVIGQADLVALNSGKVLIKEIILKIDRIQEKLR